MIVNVNGFSMDRKVYNRLLELYEYIDLDNKPIYRIRKKNFNPYIDYELFV